jgi:tetratricopeptide (TPR) repeat protein
MESFAHAGQYEEAAAAAETALAMSGRHAWALCGLAYIYGSWGRKAEATKILDEAKARSRHEYVQPSMLAIAAISAGEWEKSLAYAERAESERDPLFVLLARLWPECEPMRNDTRFNAIVDRLRLPGYHAASSRW